MKIGVIVLHFNGDELTEKCLRSLQSQNGVDLQICLVDNSVAGFQSASTFDTITYIRTANKGFSHGNNQGLQFLKNQAVDYVWLLNNDAFPQADACKNLVEVCRSTTPTLAGSKLLNEDGSVQAIRGEWYVDQFTGAQVKNKEANRGIVYPVGASLMMNKAALNALDWSMDESYFLYFEEVDLVCRLSKKGSFDVRFAENSFVTHLEGASAGSGHGHQDRSTFSEYHFNRSRALFYKKHFPTLKWKLDFLIWMVALKRLISLKFTKAKACIQGHFSV